MLPGMRYSDGDAVVLMGRVLEAIVSPSVNWRHRNGVISVPSLPAKPHHAAGSGD